MIQIGHFSEKSEVVKLDYQPVGAYSLDIEIFSVSSLRKRVSKEDMLLPHQHDFGMLIFIFEGECTQWIDFKKVNSKAGSLLTISPGQYHRFGEQSDWDGWLMLFRPEFVSAPALKRPQTFNFRVKELTQNIPDHLVLDEREQAIVAQTIGQMREDSAMAGAGDSNDINALMHHQFYTLLLRLSIVHGENSGSPSHLMQRFKAFKDLVEENYTRWHQVAQYASNLGCSEKSLTRAAVEVTGVTAKNIIASRVNLEAKRLLANSTLSVALIADQLGFDEPTNFVKFFKRQVTCTPGEFRKTQRAI